MAEITIIEPVVESNKDLSSQLIPVANAVVGQEQVPTVNARQLHSFLRVKSRFNDWIKRRIREFEFKDGVDYIAVLKNEHDGIIEQIDYILTVPMAKELSMVERTPKGKQARKYFMECERRYFESIGKGHPAGPVRTTLPISTKEDRAPIRILTAEWARKMAAPDTPSQGHHKSACNQLNANFGLKSITELPEAWVTDAIAWIQSKIDGLTALPSAEPIAALPAAPAPRRVTFEDYQKLYPGLVCGPQHWELLRDRIYTAMDVFMTELKAVQKEAINPFQINRKSNVQNYLDAAMGPMHNLWDSSTENMRMSYKNAYDALDGCRDTWMLLHKG